MSGAAIYYLFGINARVSTPIQVTEYYSVHISIQESQCEALFPANVWKRVEPYQSNFLYTARQMFLKNVLMLIKEGNILLRLAHTPHQFYAFANW